jgi:hypothetical protein
MEITYVICTSPTVFPLSLHYQLVSNNILTFVTNLASERLLKPTKADINRRWKPSDERSVSSGQGVKSTNTVTSRSDKSRYSYSTPGRVCNFHVLSHLLLIYICKLHWNLNTMFLCQVIFFWFTYVISMSYVIYYWFTYVNSTGIDAGIACPVSCIREPGPTNPCWQAQRMETDDTSR